MSPAQAPWGLRLDGWVMRGSGVPRALTALSLGLVALLGLGIELGLWECGRRRAVLEPRALTRWTGEGALEEGQAFQAQVPLEGASVARGSRSRLALWEDGRLLSSEGIPPQFVDRYGGGRSGHWGRLLVFSSSDGSDPRLGLHRYEIDYPWSLGPWLWLLACAACALGAPWLRAGLIGLERASPWRVGLALLVLTLALRALWRNELSLVTEAWLGDLPLADAQRWLALSEDFAGGTRIHSEVWEVWGARAPLTYVLAGSWAALLGFSVGAIALLHTLMSGLSTLLIWDALRRLVPVPLALLGALVHATSPYDAAYALTPSSEPSAQFLTNVALWALVWALEAEARRAAGERGPRWAYFAAGVALALSHLAGSSTLAVLAGVPLAIGLLRWRGCGDAWRRALRVALVGGVCCGLGAVVTCAPWLARQRVVDGIWFCSDDAAARIHATSDPRSGASTPPVSSEPDRAGAQTRAERVASFERRTREHLRADPSVLGREVIDRSGRALTDQLAAPAPYFALGLLLLGLWGGPGRAPPGWLSACLALGLAYGLGDACGWAPRTEWWLLLASALALIRGAPLALLGLSLGWTLISMGLVSAPHHRATFSLQWLALSLALWAPWELARLAQAGTWPQSLRQLEEAGVVAPVPSRAGCARGIGVLLALLGAALIAGLGVALARHARGADPVALRPLAARPAWLESALGATGAEPYRELWPQLAVERSTFRPAFQTFASAGDAWGGAELPLHEGHQELSRTLFLPAPRLTAPFGPYAHCLFPGRLEASAGQELTLVGIWVRRGPDHESVFEVLAWTSDPEPGAARWHFGGPQDRPRHAALLLAERARGRLGAPR